MGSEASKQTTGRLESLKSSFTATESTRIEQTFKELASPDGSIHFSDFQVLPFRGHPSILTLELESVQLSTFVFLCYALPGDVAQRLRSYERF